MSDKTSQRVLLAEDDAALRDIVRALLEEAGIAVTAVEDGQLALDTFRQAAEEDAPFGLVVSDINMPKLDGLALIDALKALDPEVLVVFVTAYSSVESAVSALRKGAYDYLTKPFRNDRLIQVVKNALQQRALFAENRALKREIERIYGFQDIVGRSPGMEGLFRVLEKAAPTAASILIRGETGAGKEVVARAIHRASDRAEGPFVSVNCAALPEGLLESELFGHAKGAFSGAVARSLGLFRAADKGTLFLDEVAEMPLAVQAKLLRALETREIRAIGTTEPISVDVRVLAASNKELLAEVEAGRFREDLYYRFAVIEIEVPPLRERPEDIPLLARHFLRALARERGEGERKLSPEALDLMAAHAWPGNVRELRNALERAVTLGGETIAPSDLPPRLRRAAGKKAGEERGPARSGPGGAPLSLAELERRHVAEVLAELGGDRRRAADLLEIDLSTLYRKLKRWKKEDGDGAED